MPTYDYHCINCGEELEARQKMTDTPLKECPACHQQTLQRGPGGGIGLQFKGSGFYLTDYCGQGTPQEGRCGCGQKTAQECASEK